MNEKTKRRINRIISIIMVFLVILVTILIFYMAIGSVLEFVSNNQECIMECSRLNVEAGKVVCVC